MKYQAIIVEGNKSAFIGNTYNSLSEAINGAFSSTISCELQDLFRSANSGEDVLNVTVFTLDSDNGYGFKYSKINKRNLNEDAYVYILEIEEV